MDKIPINENQVKISFTTWAESSKLKEPLTMIPKENIAIKIFRNIADPFTQTNKKMPILFFIFGCIGVCANTQIYAITSNIQINCAYPSQFGLFYECFGAVAHNFQKNDVFYDSLVAFVDFLFVLFFPKATKD